MLEVLEIHVPKDVDKEFGDFWVGEKLFHDLIIIRLITHHIVSNKAIAFLEIDNFSNEFLDFYLFDVDINDKEL